MRRDRSLEYFRAMEKTRDGEHTVKTTISHLVPIPIDGGRKIKWD